VIVAEALAILDIFNLNSRRVISFRQPQQRAERPTAPTVSIGDVSIRADFNNFA
jgi:hypothetical protein